MRWWTRWLLLSPNETDERLILLAFFAVVCSVKNASVNRIDRSILYPASRSCDTHQRFTGAAFVQTLACTRHYFPGKLRRLVTSLLRRGQQQGVQALPTRDWQLPAHL